MLLNRRSKWKIPYIASVFFKKRFLTLNSHKIKLRNSIISNMFIKKKFLIYNGRFNKSLVIKPDIIGYKLGEFCFTKPFDTQVQIKAVSKKKGKKHQRK